MVGNVFIVHGADGHPEENWFPWLKNQLEQKGYQVFVPKFPTPENQTLDQWMKVLDQYIEHINKDTIFVGHSLGVPFILNVLEKHRVNAAYLVAGFTGLAGNHYDPSMKTFAQREFKWDSIRANCDKFVVFHADNDPYIDLGKGKELADNLGVELNIVNGAGHFSEAAGYTEFDELLAAIY